MRWTINAPMIAVFLFALLLVLGVAVMRAPFYLPTLDENAPPVPKEDSYVFGFATLTNPVVRFIVVGRVVPAEPAALRGFTRFRRDLRDSPDLILQGVKFRATPAELQRLDRYERAGRKYRRDLLTLEDGTTAWVYRLIGETGLAALQD